MVREAVWCLAGRLERVRAGQFDEVRQWQAESVVHQVQAGCRGAGHCGAVVAPLVGEDFDPAPSTHAAVVIPRQLDGAVDSLGAGVCEEGAAHGYWGDLGEIVGQG